MTTTSDRDRRDADDDRQVAIGRAGADGSGAAHGGSYSAAAREAALGQGRAFGHDARGARDRVGESRSRRPTRRTARRRAAPPSRRRAPTAPRRRPARSRRWRRDADAPRASAARNWRERIERQLRAERIGQRAQDRPVLARVAGREHRALGELRPPLGVDVDARLLGIGRAGQDHVGAMRAAVAMRADIDDEGAGLDVDLVGAEIEEHVERARLGHRSARRARPRPARGRDRGRRRARPRCAAR